MLQNLNQREKVFLIGGAGALLLLVIIFGIILPYRSALARLDDKVALRQNQLQEVQALQAEFGKLRNELSHRERKLARNPDASAFSSIENIVVRLGFRDKLIAMRPQPASEREGMRVEAVSARLERINLALSRQILLYPESAPPGYDPCGHLSHLHDRVHQWTMDRGYYGAGRCCEYEYRC